MMRFGSRYFVVWMMILLTTSFSRRNECEAFSFSPGSTPPSLLFQWKQPPSTTNKRQHNGGAIMTRTRSSSRLGAISSKSKFNNNHSNKKTTMLDQFSEWFCGDFDNYEQVVEDRQNGLLPREGGGHEQIHCTLVPIPPNPQQNQDQQQQRHFLAAFYFDGTPQRIFRFRFYQVSVVLHPHDNDDNANNKEKNDNQNNNNDNNDPKLRMKLFTLSPDLEGQMRRNAQSPMEWPRVFQEYVTRSTNNNDHDNDYNDRLLQVVQELPGCDVEWSHQPDPQQHDYYILEAQQQQQQKQQKQQQRSPPSQDNAAGMMEELQQAYHAIMVHGEALVESQMVPGQQIRIQDQLSLRDMDFWIHDRGFDPVTGDYLYGNQNNVPYHLKRVTSIVTTTTTAPPVDGSKPTQQQRVVVSPELQWTLGPQWRDEQEYIQRMDVIGGVSAKMNS